jgi:hypothetical protein
MATLFAFAILSACAADDRSAAGTDMPADTTDGAAAPMPESPAAGDRWALSPTGLGPVRAGMSVADASRALGGELDSPSDPACSYVKSARAPDGVSFMIVDGSVARIDVESPDVATGRGARIGDTEESVQALYGDALTVQPQKYTEGHDLIVTPADTTYRLVFQTEDGKVIRMRSGRLPSVLWVEGCS